jgi:hypothetical protein
LQQKSCQPSKIEFQPYKFAVTPRCDTAREFAMSRSRGKKEATPAKAHKHISNGHSVTVTPNGGGTVLNGNAGLRLKTGLAEMLKGGVIMDVTDARQAEIAEKAGAAAVMALERVPAQIRAQGGVARMASPKKIREIMETVSIPVMAKCRIGFGRGLHRRI